jgi:hypothetical protein
VVVDDGVVPHYRICLATVDLNAVIVGRARRLEIVDIIALDQGAGALSDIEAVFDVVDVVAQEAASAGYAAAALIVGANSVDLAVLYNDARTSRLDLDGGKAVRGNLAVLDRDVVGIDVNGALDI